ncbi:hypothetical protein ABBQ38_001683 [Trebouxia sp. C0009 RCD-2024]
MTMEVGLIGKSRSISTSTKSVTGTETRTGTKAGTATVNAPEIQARMQMDQGEDSKDRHTENAADHGRKSPRPEQKSDSPSTAIAAEGAVPAGPSDSTAEPAAIRPQVQDSGGEVSMSIEETNRVRISLGLKPLSMVNNADTKRKEFEARQKVLAEQEQDAQAAALAERVQKKREKRKMEESLRKVKTLGQADKEVDDLAKWVTKSRTREEEDKELAREEALNAQRRQAEQDEQEDEEKELQGLKGLKVKHSANELLEGETMILTLADKNILDDKGELDDEEQDELENVLAAEQKKRSKARKESQKAPSRFEEEKEKRGLLDKYDEEEEEAAMLIGDQGTINDEARKRQEEIRSKLQSVDARARPGFDQAKDYYTSEEAAKFMKPKKKLKKKVRVRKATDEEGAGLDLAALEAEAAASGKSELGSRKDTAGRAAQAQKAQIADEAQRQSKYDAALEKAKYNALALQQAAAAREDEVIGEEDDDLYESLARARRAADKQQKQGVANLQDTLAEQLASRRDQDEAHQAMDTDRPAGQGLEFTEASEFARSIQLREPDDAAARTADGAGHMGVDDTAAASAATPAAEPAPAARPPPKRNARSKWGSWVSATEEEGEAQDEEMPDAPSRAEPKQEEQEDSMIREAAIGKGMAGVLHLLKDRGELTQRMQWAGRTNDMKPVMLQGLEEVYQSGAHSDEIANRVELALTRRDEYGRVLTPKQAFREVSYRFHGIEPSKKSKEKIQRKVRDEMAARKAATSEQPAGTLNQLKHAQAKANTPYVVLTGNIRPGQSSDPKSGYATVDSQVALTPMLSGGRTPLVGDRKVEAMLGIKKRSGHDSMPPPANRPNKKARD